MFSEDLECSQVYMMRFLSGFHFSVDSGLRRFIFPCHFLLCINTLYNLFVRMHMEEVNRLLQFFFIIETLTKISNGLRTCGVYGRVTISKEICLKDKRRRLLLQGRTRGGNHHQGGIHIGRYQGYHRSHK